MAGPRGRGLSRGPWPRVRSRSSSPLGSGFGDRDTAARLRPGSMSEKRHTENAQARRDPDSFRADSPFRLILSETVSSTQPSPTPQVSPSPLELEGTPPPAPHPSGFILSSNTDLLKVDPSRRHKLSYPRAASKVHSQMQALVKHQHFTEDSEYIRAPKAYSSEAFVSSLCHFAVSLHASVALPLRHKIRKLESVPPEFFTVRGQAADKLRHAGGAVVPGKGQREVGDCADTMTRAVVFVLTDAPSPGLGPCGWFLVIVSFLFTLITFPVSVWMCIKIIKEYERAIIFRLGRILQGGAKGPGLFFILPCTDNFIKVDMRTISFDIPPQEILTKDSVTVSVDGVVYYRVQNATLAVANITNADSATRLLAQTTLRNVLGTKNLSQILSDREEIAHNMQCTLDDATDDWGIKVERVEIKDVKLPVQLQRAMAAEAEASREARAKVIAAEGEMNASRALKEASIVITESPAALQLRYLQTLTTIAAEKNSTIVFPLPIDMLQGLMGAKK
ncbi:Erythrocyte band 7 integral membrane protein [Galemys pyrenaicus]|uniref:Erythrocyte band 7 integral membrane protein n=1 Tax=Galemys pyrenaicus TaxID=202257 RepID=A0A8J6DS99_GALPY|nr:Erythrocyte band 7 integral membrane protein [Galemys pyrenaicus]